MEFEIVKIDKYKSEIIEKSTGKNALILLQEIDEENKVLKNVLKDIIGQVDIVYKPSGSIQRIFVDIDKKTYDLIYKVCFDG